MKAVIKNSCNFLKGEITLPASKSISNRLLIIKALCNEPIHIEDISLADDTVLMEKLLEEVKIPVNSGYQSKFINLDAKNAGTVFRFLTAYLATRPGSYYLTGDERMKQRPVGELVDALVKLGADIKYKGEKGYPPLKINGKTIKGGSVEVDAGISSQFISAILMIAPEMQNPLTLRLKGNISSTPYINMTIELMNYFGAGVEWTGNSIKVKSGAYMPKEITVESDWSAASYLYILAAFSEKCELFLKNLYSESLQGDSVVAEIFEDFGVKTEFQKDGIKLTKSDKRTDYLEYDFTNTPDLAQTVAVCSAGLNIPAKLTGLKSLRIKETDRLSALQKELSKLGKNTEIVGDELYIYPFDNKGLQPLVDEKQGQSLLINTYNDHRMAMAFAPLAMILPEIIIDNPEVVSKSYPGYWEDLQKLGFEVKFET